MAPRDKHNRVTIRTVAEDSGVSVSAVSKVLRNAYGVSDSLRGRVQASMEKLGYRPHTAARGMRGQTYTLGIVLPDIHNPFFTDIMSGVNSALERTQYQTLFGIGYSNPTTEQAVVDAMVDRQMDGIIFIGPRISPDAVRDLAHRIPMSLIAYYDAVDHYDTVNNDDELGAALVVQHLAQSGYNNIAMISLPVPSNLDSHVTQRRETGYRKAMDKAGLRRFTKVVMAEQTPREVQAAARQLLRSRGRPDAIFCWTDFIALEVLSVAKELGLAVPGDLAVVGYDNTSYCDLAQNDLTSVDQSGQVLGLQAARLLVERIEGRKTGEHFMVTPRLVVRGSSSPRNK
ncbi:LacI family DNA-binding transcriptional regulator [Roseovarius sp.]|uniref:LacI family DNA-binding transcriptional regulator n=1 Tax=Roseovarius sp. TaxID=1486281 RepID=UPI003A96C717